MSNKPVLWCKEKVVEFVVQRCNLMFILSLRFVLSLMNEMVTMMFCFT